MRPVWPVAVVACLIVLARVAVEVVSVYFFSPAVTAMARGFGSSEAHGFFAWFSGSTASVVSLRRTLCALGISQIALGVMIYLRNIWDCKFSMHVVFHIRGAIYDRLQNVGLSLHDRMSSGQLINRALSDLQNVRAFVNASLLTSLDIVASVGGYLLLLFLRSPWLMAAALVPLPFWCVVIFRFSRKAQPAFRAQQEAADKVMSALSENLSGVQVVRAFGTEEYELSRYRELNNALFTRMLSMVRLQCALTPLLKGIATFAHIGLFVISAFLIRAGRMQVGDLMILGVAMGTILAKLQQVNLITEIYQKAMVSGRRFFEVLDTPDSTPIMTGARFPKITRGHIDFEGVVFGYDPERPVLRGIDTRILGGKVTALIGPTGAGKTTFAGLIARLYDPIEGTVRLDGVDLRELDLHALRRAVGYIFQETFLFSDTIRGNIAYGRSDVDADMIRAAARAAHAEEFILGLPHGYDTRLSEGGTMLSGGQRQRLAIARALVYDPQILVLDDATAALDSGTESAVHEALRPYFKGRTVLVIAHNLKTIRAADCVLVLDRGRVIQNGHHDDLIQLDGHYRDLVKSQYIGARESQLAFAGPEAGWR